MQQTMDAMAARWLTVDGVPTSLKDLGYSDCGLDDKWVAWMLSQQCGLGPAESHPSWSRFSSLIPSLCPLSVLPPTAGRLVARA